MTGAEFILRHEGGGVLQHSQHIDILLGQVTQSCTVLLP